MRTLAPGASVTVEVPATSANLGPGFDCFGLALSWRERVQLTVTDGGYAVEVTGEGAAAVPRDETHLILSSALLGLADLGWSAPGLLLRCHNTIPHGRGLGSSSAAIVAGLLAAAGLTGGGQEDGALRRWLLRHADAIEGHPDNVAAAIHGGFVLAWVGGTGLDAVTSPVHPDLAVTAFVCETPVETRRARGLLPSTVPHSDAAHNAGRSALLVHALQRDPDRLLDATADWLHQDYRRGAMPASWQLMQDLRGQGHAAVISGAGPTVLVLGGRGTLPPVQGRAGFRRVDLEVGTAAALLTTVDAGGSREDAVG